MIQQIVTEVAGLVGVLPKIIYIKTNDTVAQVTATGYLNNASKQGFIFSEYDMALVATKINPSDTDPQLALFQISISGGNISLVSLSGPGSVALPTIANHLAVYTNTIGALGEDATTAINGGNIQAGLSGTAGSLASFPATAASGSLLVSAVANVGNKTTTISSVAGLGQNQVITVPDVGAATGNFILSGSGGTQNITAGALQVNAGVISSGISTGGTAGGFIAYPATASNGSVRIVPVGNAGNFAVTVSPVSTQGQASVITIPDAGNAVGRFLIAASATPFVAGNIPQASGTGGLMVDSGVSFASLAPVTVSITMNTASVVGAYATPVQIVAGQAGKAIMILAAQIITEVSTPFATGGVAQLQWGNTNHAGGTVAADATIPAAEITAAASQIYTQYGVATTAVNATAAVTGLGIYFTNATGAYTNGTGSTVTVVLQYMLIPAV
ncbi:MAG: hypothetical protein V4568_18010 [Pseudomonadota bacterium]